MMGNVEQLTDNGWLVIEFHHPKGNGMTADMLSHLEEIITGAATQSAVQGVLLRSGGTGAFCGGASLEELHQLSSLKAAKAFFLGFARVISSIRNAPQPIVARVHGKCVGGGLGIVAAADLAFATQEASIRLSELSLGIGPFVIGPAVERKMGIAAFTRLCFQPHQWRPAGWALEKGMYTDVFPSVEALDIALEEQLQVMRSWDHEAITVNKRMTWELTPDWKWLMEQRAEQVAELWMKRKETGRPG